MASDWVIAAASIVNGLLLLGLIYVTRQYATETKRIASAARKEAKASIELARETQAARVDAVRPVIDIGVDPFAKPGHELLEEAFSGQPPKALRCTLRNVGVGPALNLAYDIQVGSEIGRKRVGVLAVGEQVLPSEEQLPLKLEASARHGVITIHYEDAFANRWESRLEVAISEEGHESYLLRVIRAERVV